MKVICSKDELMKGIQTVLPITPSKSSLPVLSNFLFQTKGDKIRLASTDLEIAVKSHIKGEIIKEGEITIQSKRFADIIRELPSDSQIEITTDESNQINITTEKTKFNLTGIAASEYPVIPEFQKENNFVINKNLFISMLKKTFFAVSKDSQRYILNGVYFIVENGILKMVATDGRRLAYIFTEGIKEDVKKKAIVPSKAINDILRIINIDIKDEDIKIAISDNQTSIAFDDITLTTTLIDGTFPNFEQVIPKKTDLKAKVKTQKFLEAVKIMKTMVNDKPMADGSSAITFSFGNNILKISATSAGIGSGETMVEIEYSDKPIDIKFNPDFIKDVLVNIDDEFLNFDFSDSLNPALISPQNNKNYLCVVMPMRI
jgi:DNA polymerase-3 subunit beta